MFALLVCVGGAYIIGSDDTAAEGETYEIQYVVADTTYSLTGTSATVTLKTVGELGLTLPEGKQMDGWQYHGTAITVDAGSTVTLSATEPTVFDAIISDIEYTIQFLDGETVISTATYGYGDDIVTPTDPMKAGHTFGGWSPAVAETVSADATYTAQWKAIYSVSWVVEDVTVATGTTEKSQTLKIPTDPVKESYRFLGWFDTDGVRYTATYEFSGDTIFTASFAAAEGETYEIQYVVADTTYSYTGTESSVILKSLEDLNIALADGKQMDGWMYSGTTITVAVGSTVILDSSTPTIFNAIISDIEYTVQFMDGETVVSTATYTYGQTIVVPDSPTKDGYTFAGWDPAVPDTVSESIEFVATWDKIFDVTWTVEGVNVAFGTTGNAITLNVPADPIKESYRFLGWFDASGVMYDAAYEFDANTIFSASFAANVYTVTFVYGETAVTFITETVSHGEKAVRPMDLPEGYSGWNWNFDTAITEDVTINAVASAPGAPSFWTTGWGQCTIVLVVFLAGVLVWALFTGRISVPKIGVKKE